MSRSDEIELPDDAHGGLLSPTAPASAPQDDPRLPGPAPAEVRQLVVCCDGTNSTLTGDTNDTNVLQLFTQLQRARDPEQSLYYDPGVGSATGLPATSLSEVFDRPLQRLVSLGIGRGIYENVGQAYMYLCREYRAGDQLYLFGFSRGAFTVRCVGGMVNLFGLIRPEHEPLLPTLLSLYFAGDRERGLLRRLTGDSDGEPGAARRRAAEQVRASFTSLAGHGATVHFTGVWDTVESVGIPGLRASNPNGRSIAGKRFTHVRHALSIDEHRRQFLPRYYGPDVDAHQTMQQLWFRGNHSDIGGGYRRSEAALAQHSLNWMLGQAGAAGLRWCHPMTTAENPHAVLHDALYTTPWWALGGMAARDPSADTPGGNTAGLQLDAPAEHQSLEQETPSTVWDHRRPLGKLAVALAIVLGLLVLAALQPTTSGNGWLPALLDSQTAWVDVLGAAPSAAPDQLARALPWNSPPLTALLLELAFFLAVAYVLAYPATRVFARLTAGRRVGDPPPPAWLNLLGRALPLMVLGFVVEFVAHSLALLLGLTPLAWLLLVIGGLGTLAKWVGIAGAVALVVGGGVVLWRRGRVEARDERGERDAEA